MANPTPYTVQYSFSGFQANNPTSPLPAPKVDNELANIAVSNASIISAIEDVRRSDGALKNGVVTFDALTPGLQFTIDPTNGEAVAAAIVVAQASAAAAAVSDTSAGTSATAAATSATAAAASAATVDLTNYLAKANNLAGIGSPDTARANLDAAKVDGSDMIGRLATVTLLNVSDWNSVVTSGWFAGGAATPNAPDTLSTWLAQVIAFSANSVTQIAYCISNAGISTSDVTIYRRHSYDNAGVRTWQPWESASPVPVGSTIWVNGTTAPAGFLKENGALLSRTDFPALYAFASASGNIVSDATWLAGSTGAFSTGDSSTTFRIPDSRGEFIRSWDDSRGADPGRSIGVWQPDALKDHTHTVPASSNGVTYAPNAGSSTGFSSTPQSSGGSSLGSFAETRPRNVAKLACIKF
jgi:hypothetical protein